MPSSSSPARARLAAPTAKAMNTIGPSHENSSVLMKPLGEEKSPPEPRNAVRNASGRLST